MSLTSKDYARVLELLGPCEDPLVQAVLEARANEVQPQVQAWPKPDLQGPVPIVERIVSILPEDPPWSGFRFWFFYADLWLRDMWDDFQLRMHCLRRDADGYIQRA